MECERFCHLKIGPSLIRYSSGNTCHFINDSVDPNEPNDFKEAYDVMEPYNDDIPWPTGSCSDFHKTVKNFYKKCDKLSHAILNLISYGLKLEVSM